MSTDFEGDQLTPYAYKATTKHLNKFNSPEKMGLLLYVKSTENDSSVLIKDCLNNTDKSLRSFVQKMTNEGTFVNVSLGGGNKKHLILSRGLKEELEKFYSLFV